MVDDWGGASMAAVERGSSVRRGLARAGQARMNASVIVNLVVTVMNGTESTWQSSEIETAWVKKEEAGSVLEPKPCCDRRSASSSQEPGP